MSKKLTATEVDRMSGLRLKAVREVLGITQEKLASHIGASRTQLANWEGGKIPDPRAMVRLLTHYQIPLDWIYAGLTRTLPYDVAQEIECKAEKLGATIGAPAPAWERGRLTGRTARPAAAKGSTRAPTGGGPTLHEAAARGPKPP